jgi:hypothetical protein
MAQPERIQQIRDEHAKRVTRMRQRTAINPLRPAPETVDLDDLYGASKACLICHK